MAWPNGNRLKTFASGGSFLPGDANNIEDRMLQLAGYRGKSIIPTEESRTNTAFGLMTTPDRVQGIVVPTDGLLCVAYQALWKETVGAAARAAIFLGANQLKMALYDSAPTVVGARNIAGAVANLYSPLTSFEGGLIGSGAAAGNSSSDVTTGQLVGVRQDNASEFYAEMLNNESPRGGVACIFATAGTYDISVQFRATSGTVTVKERKLWVWTEAFE